jgi:branched-subunit amino acid transport protein
MAAPRPQSKAGFVYVLSNEAMPGIVKIGMTARNPEVRLREINSATGVLPFELEAVIVSRNAKWTEREVHERLAACRVSKSREFFRIDAAKAKKAVFEVARQQQQRAYDRGRQRLSPIPATALAASMIPSVAMVHPYLVPAWAMLCLAAAVTGKPRMIREFLGMTRRIFSAIVVGIMATAGALLVTRAMGRDGLTEAGNLASETLRILLG